ncbi:MAG: DNA polymerase Y family protein [Pseudomonadales bacterium]|nr:DNA polymerase Y family protein [Pseudomonadales bacterium]
MSPANTPLWICLYFERLALEVFTRNERQQNTDKSPQEPAQTQRPIVISEKNRVFQLNNIAAELGILQGSSLDTAYILSDQIISLERNPDKETTALAHLAQWAYQFTPNISIKSPNYLLLDITGCLSLFKGLTTLTSLIKGGLAQQGYHPLIAANRTPLAALLMAQAQIQIQPNEFSDAYSGKDAYSPTNAHSPTKTQALAERVSQSIQAIPVCHLQATEKILTSLQQMGINRISDLLNLPNSGLIRRFGKEFSHYLQRLTGAQPDPQQFISPGPRFFHDINFLSDVSNLNSLVFPMKRLLAELEKFLTSRQLYIDHLTWHLCHRNHNNSSFSINLANPDNNAKIFLDLTQLKLDQIHQSRQHHAKPNRSEQTTNHTGRIKPTRKNNLIVPVSIKEIDQIILAVEQFSPARANSCDLFQNTESQPTSTTNQDYQLINILHARLGQESCFGLSESNDHRPEKAWRKSPLKQKNTVSTYSDADPQGLPPRPAFLLTRPQALAVTGDNWPAIRANNRLELIRGPERIDYGWWDQPLNKSVTRDYYIGREKHGGLYWIFQYTATGRWYLHGIFS